MSKRTGNAEQVELRFPTDIANHEMTIVQDSGLFRHVQFRQPTHVAYWFDITTWPGFLCISGDMGCYVFSRIQDMFEFFRGKGAISYGYWAEKLQAVDRNSPAMEWSKEDFLAYVKDEAAQYADGSSSKFKKRLLATVGEQLRFVDCSNRHEAVTAVMAIEIDDHYPFSEFCESSCEDYTHQFIWCCQAIRWGINQYDAAKVEVAAK